MKRQIITLSIAAILVCLCACGNTNEQPEPVPNQMVARIDISVEPEDADMVRSYSDQEHLSPITRMLRELDTGEEPEMSPYQSGEHVLYTIAITYANGNTNRYSIMDNRYFRTGDGEWCQPAFEQITELIDFIRDNPNE